MRQYLNLALVIGIFLTSYLPLTAKEKDNFASNIFKTNPPISRVIIVILENQDLQVSMQYAFHRRLQKEGALLKNYHGLERPSQPNYLALVAGETFGVRSNKPVNLSARHIGDLLEEKQLTWKSYAEGYPGDCFLGEKYGDYTRKHNPMVSFQNIQRNPGRCAFIVDGPQFFKDFESNTLPNVSIFIPDNKNSAHDTSASYADAYLVKHFTQVLNKVKQSKDTLFILTYDEGGRTQNHATLLFGPMVKAGSSSNEKYTHYNLLRTIEAAFNLASLGKSDASAKIISDIWN